MSKVYTFLFYSTVGVLGLFTLVIIAGALARPSDQRVPGIEHSDDYDRHKVGFLKMANRLINQRECTEAHFDEMGGFTRSTKWENAYFTYCGAVGTNSNKVYVLVKPDGEYAIRRW